MIEIIYGVVCVAMLVVVLFLCACCVHALCISWRHAPPVDRKDWPKVALIIPCKGVDPNLEENLRRHFHHDYPDYVIIFTLANIDDPASPIIQKLIQKETGPAATMVIAPRLPDCVEKASNQVAALQSLDSNVEVIVCADSDGLPRDRYWLCSLVSALERCSLVSGFRWYVPPRPALVGYLQSAWDSTWLLVHALGKTTWGGAMAYPRQTGERLRFEDHLRCAITDDLVLQGCTHRAGERTAFTAGAMVIAEPAQRFADFYRFAVRQSQIVRLVMPWAWLMGFTTANLIAAFFMLSVVMLFVPGPRLGWPLPAAALSLVAFYYLVRGLVSYRLARLLFPDHAEKTAALRWVYFWANPLADLLAPIVLYASLLSSTVRWRGISYRVRGGRVVRV